MFLFFKNLYSWNIEIFSFFCFVFFFLSNKFLFFNIIYLENFHDDLFKLIISFNLALTFIVRIINTIYVVLFNLNNELCSINISKKL